MARMKQKGRDLIDTDSGEVMDGAFAAVIMRRQKNGFEKGRFVAMSQDATEQILNDKSLKYTELRVLLFINSVLDYQNAVQLNQAEAARKLGIDRSQFNRALSVLERQGYILRGPKVNKNASFILNPEIAWKGDGRTHQLALKEHRKTLEQRKKQAGITGIVEGGAIDEKAALEAAGQTRLVF